MCETSCQLNKNPGPVDRPFRSLVIVPNAHGLVLHNALLRISKRKGRIKLHIPTHGSVCSNRILVTYRVNGPLRTVFARYPLLLLTVTGDSAKMKLSMHERKRIL